MAGIKILLGPPSVYIANNVLQAALFNYDSKEVAP